MCTDTVGPRRSTPAVVAKRVCRPCWSELWTRLAAATTARSNASSCARPGRHLLVEHDRAAAQPLGGVLAHLEIVGAGRRPPVDRPRLVAGNVLAQAVELAWPEPHRLRQEVAPEDAVAELGHRQLERPRRDEDLVDAGDDVDGAGQAEKVGAHGDERTDRQHAAPLGRDPVAGALLPAAAHRRHGHPRRAVGTDGLDQLETRAQADAVGPDDEVDPTDVAGGEHLGAHPAAHADPRSAQQHDEVGRRRTR